MDGWTISTIILGVGFFIFLFFIFRGRRKAKAIKHYEDIRDELTIRKEETEEDQEEEYAGSGFSIGNIIGGIIILMVGFSIMPEIAKSFNEVSNSTDVTVATSTLVNLMPMATLFFALAIGMMTIGMIMSWLKRSIY